MFLEAVGNILLMVDEADAQFGGFSSQGSNSLDVERRLTANVQLLMADPAMVGKVVWLLMTARIDKLPTDIISAGRAGDVIIPVLDPKDDDLRDFVHWILEAANASGNAELVQKVLEHTKGYSAGLLATLRKELLKAAAIKGQPLTGQEVLQVIQNRLPQDDVGNVREIQALEALIRATHLQLLPKETQKDWKQARAEWKKRLEELRADEMLRKLR
jgi:hypothetical protein